MLYLYDIDFFSSSMLLFMISYMLFIMLPISLSSINMWLYLLRINFLLWINFSLLLYMIYIFIFWYGISWRFKCRKLWMNFKKTIDLNNIPPQKNIINKPELRKSIWSLRHSGFHPKILTILKLLKFKNLVCNLAVTIKRDLRPQTQMILWNRVFIKAKLDTLSF